MTIKFLQRGLLPLEESLENPLEEPLEDPLEEPLENPLEETLEEPLEDPLEDPLEEPLEGVELFEELTTVAPPVPEPPPLLATVISIDNS